MPTRRRLTPQQRRDELLDAGERIFTERPFEDVSMEDIAAFAGVTRALLYHYFSSKAEFFGAIWARAHTRLGGSFLGSEPRTIRDGVADSLQSYMNFYAAHLPLVVIANRSSISREPAVRGSVERSFALLCGRILDAAGAEGRSRQLAETAFAAWIAFVREAALATYLDARMTSAENLAMCMAAFEATVGAHADLARPAKRG